MTARYTPAHGSSRGTGPRCFASLCSSSTPFPARHGSLVLKHRWQLHLAPSLHTCIIHRSFPDSRRTVATKAQEPNREDLLDTGIPPAAQQTQAPSSATTAQPSSNPSSSSRRLKQFADTYSTQSQHQQGTTNIRGTTPTTIPPSASIASAEQNGVPPTSSAGTGGTGGPRGWQFWRWGDDSGDSSSGDSSDSNSWGLAWLQKRAGKVVTQVALFVALGAAYCFALLAWARGGPLRQDRPYTFTAVFQDASGVYKGTPLRMKGVQIGQAKEMHTDLTTASVVVQVNEQSNIIPAGSSIDLNHSGLFGDTFLDVVLPQGEQAPGHVLRHRHGPSDAGCAAEGVLVCHNARLVGRQGGNMDEMMRNMIKRNGPARPWVQ